MKTLLCAILLFSTTLSAEVPYLSKAIKLDTGKKINRLTQSKGDILSNKKYCNGDIWPLPKGCCDGSLPEISPLCGITCDGSQTPTPPECCDGTIPKDFPVCNLPTCDGSEWPLPKECCDGSLSENSPFCGITCDGNTSNPLPEFPLPSECCNGDIPQNFPLCELNCEDTGGAIPSECCDGTLPVEPPICLPPPPICDGGVWPLPDGCCGNTNPGDNSPYCDIRCEGDISNPLPGLPLPNSCCNGDINEDFPLCEITCDGSEWPLPSECCDGTLEPRAPLCNAPACDGSEWPLNKACCDGSLPQNSPFCGITCDGDSLNPLPQFPLPNECCNGDIPQNFPLCELNCEDTGGAVPSECCDGTLPVEPPICLPPPPICDGSEWPLPGGCCGNTNPGDNSPYCDIRCEGDISNPLPDLPLPNSCCNGEINFNFPLCGIICDGTEVPEPVVCCDGTLDPLPGFCNLTPIGNDPLYSDAWHLENTGQNNYARIGGTAGFDIKATPVVESGIRGQGVKVAVSDTGIEITHEDLDGNFSLPGSRDFSISSTQDNPPLALNFEKIDAHGTAVTGIIAALGGNNIGSRGVAPDVQFGGFNYLASPAFWGSWPYQADGPFDIFNYSYGSVHCNLTYAVSYFINAYKNGVTNLRNGKGSLYVKAAGNDWRGSSSSCTSDPNWLTNYYGNSNFDEGQNYPYTLLIGAINADGKKASYSTPGSNIWVSAPGGEDGFVFPAIMSTDFSGCDKGMATSFGGRNSFDQGRDPKNTECNYTSAMNGTSSAAPNTSGVIALMLSANPELSWRDVKHILATHSTIINPDDGPYNHPGGRDLVGHTYREGWVENAAGYNFHTFYGLGLVNAQAAVSAAKVYQTDLGLQQESLSDSGKLNLAIPDNSGTGVEHSLLSKVNYTIEAVQVIVSITHPYLDNLGIELRSPSGTKSIILNINSSNTGGNFNNFTFLTNAFYGEKSLGNWTLKVIDGANVNADGTTGSTGTLTKWKLNIIGNNSKAVLKSQQKLPSGVYLSKNRKIKTFPRPKITLRKKADPRKRYAHPADQFLVRKAKDFLWSPYIFAIAEKDYRGPSTSIIGELFGMKVITSLIKPSKGYYVVKSRTTHELGIYLKRIFAFGNNAEIEKSLKKRLFLKWDKVAGTYVITSPFLSLAITLRKNLRFESPKSTFDLGIIYDYDRPN